MSVTRRTRLALGLFLVASGLLVVFDAAVTRAVGVAGLVASLILGASALLTHEALSDDDGDASEAESAPPSASGSPGSPLP